MHCGRIMSDSGTTSSRSTSPKSSKLPTSVGIDLAVGLALARMLTLTLYCSVSLTDRRMGSGQRMLTFVRAPIQGARF